MFFMNASKLFNHFIVILHAHKDKFKQSVFQAPVACLKESMTLCILPA